MRVVGVLLGVLWLIFSVAAVVVGVNSGRPAAGILLTVAMFGGTSAYLFWSARRV